jgi:hypothetical protein
MRGSELLLRKMSIGFILFRRWQFPDLIDEITSQIDAALACGAGS